jgi:hypothetical protein
VPEVDRKMGVSEMPQPLEINRSDLAWAISAVLPHVGKRHLDFVGFATYYDGWSIYATDGYTAGVARCYHIQPRGETFALSKREAQDLLRFVRPTLKRHDTETVQLLHVSLGYPVAGYDELHTLLPGEQDSAEPQTEVFWAQVPGKDFQSVYGLVRKVRDAHPETHPDIPYHPETFARFSKASRYDTDRLILSPRVSEGQGYGASYITVGENFEGAISGLTYEEEVAA